MKIKNKSYPVLVLLFAVTCVISLTSYLKEYTQKDTVNIHLFPKEIGSWKSRELVITDDEYAILETRNAFTREYTNALDGRKVYVFIVYSQTNRKVSHPPEVCYTGSGVSILGKSANSFPVESLNLLLTVDQLFLEHGTTKHLAFYWFKVGNSFTPSYWKQQILIAIKTLFGRPSSSALIRVSADIENNDRESTVNTLKEFTRLAMPYMVKYLP